MYASGRAGTQSSGLLIRGFGVQVPGGAPVLTCGYTRYRSPREGRFRPMFVRRLLVSPTEGQVPAVATTRYALRHDVPVPALIGPAGSAPTATRSTGLLAARPIEQVEPRPGRPGSAAGQRVG